MGRNRVGKKMDKEHKAGHAPLFFFFLFSRKKQNKTKQHKIKSKHSYTVVHIKLGNGFPPTIGAFS